MNNLTAWSTARSILGMSKNFSLTVVRFSKRVSPPLPFKVKEIFTMMLRWLIRRMKGGKV